MTSRSERLEEAISVLLSPPTLSVPAFMLLLSGYSDYTLTLPTAITFAAVLPILIFYFSKHIGITRDIFASDHKTRPVPFTLTMIGYAIGTAALYYIHAPMWALALMFTYFGNMLIVALLTLKWKVSLHAVGITGPVTVLVYALGPAMLPLMLLVLPAGWARAKLKMHTPMEIAAGAALGVLATVLQLALMHLIFA